MLRELQSACCCVREQLNQCFMSIFQTSPTCLWIINRFNKMPLSLCHITLKVICFTAEKAPHLFLLLCSLPLFSTNVTKTFFFCARRCSVCCDHLTNWYYEKDGKLYCRKHYWEKFGELCHGCSLLMTGPAMVSLLHLWFNTPSISSYTLYVFMSEEF